MMCPKCKEGGTQVLDTRDSTDGIRRRRECLSCKYRFTTYERSEPLQIMVIKKNGSKERFTPEKIRRGVLIACKNRPVSEDEIDRLVERVEQTVTFAGEDTITSREIGRLVENLLKEVDEIAYVRFLSVCESFTRVEQFSSTIKSL